LNPTQGPCYTIGVADLVEQRYLNFIHNITPLKVEPKTVAATALQGDATPRQRMRGVKA
jgi:hypothetical protein